VNTLTVWRFPAPEAAEQALVPLHGIIRAGRATIDDCVLVSWPPDRRTPATRELGSLVGRGQMWGGFWGMLLGLIFLTPLAGPSFGAAAGAFAGSLAEFGVADDFVKRVRDSVTPGTSALFVLSARASADGVAAGLRGIADEVLRTELSREQEEHLREALSDH
jgi:uncharacterized membrane protein